MSEKLAVEVHVGKRYGISRLNCGGDGQVKDVVIDNRRYNRISSQSKKRVWREHMGEYFDKMERVYRTRAAKEILTKKLSVMDNPFIRDNASDMAAYIVTNIIGCEFSKDNSSNITNQIMIFTEYDLQDIISCFIDVASDSESWKTMKVGADIAAEKKKKNKGKSKNLSKEEEAEKNIRTKIVNAIKKKLPMRSYGIETSLFGRMSTAQVLETVESSMCVNHSYSLGAATMDSDYFIAVDNYLSNKDTEAEEKQSGAGFLSTKDFATHVYYEYASIDVGHFYKNLCKGVNMDDERNRARVKETMKKALSYVLTDIVCDAPAGGQNSFASFPDPVGVYITVRDSGTNRTADTCCIKEMQQYKKTEDEKFISAISNFVNNDFSVLPEYIEKLYIGEQAEKIAGVEHKDLKTAFDMIEEIIDERF